MDITGIKVKHEGCAVLGPGGITVARCPSGIVTGTDGTYQITSADAADLARRIAACMNACAGMDIEALEIAGSGNAPDVCEWFQEWSRVFRLEEQRDALLSALKRYMVAYEHGSDADWTLHRCREMDAAEEQASLAIEMGSRP